MTVMDLKRKPNAQHAPATIKTIVSSFSMRSSRTLIGPNEAMAESKGGKVIGTLSYVVLIPLFTALRESQPLTVGTKLNNPLIYKCYLEENTDEVEVSSLVEGIRG